MRGRCLRPVVVMTFALGSAAFAGCTKPLGIVRQASDGAEAFGDRLKEKVKDLGDDLTTWEADEATITPTSAVRVDPGPTLR